MQFKNLIVIGTSHIARQSLQEVKKAIIENKPDIVALELDKKRFFALMHKKRDRLRLKDIRKIGLKGYLFSVIGAYIQKRLGESVGIAPGSEMKKAITLAKKNNIRIALIDQDIEVTLKKFSKYLTWREKWNFVVDFLKGLLFKKEDIGFDLTKVPDEQIIKKLINKVKIRYPNIYRVLVKERNQIMASNLFRIMKANPDKKILCIVGAGHAEEMIRIIGATKE